MNVSIAIVAHTTRHTMAHRLAHQISADYLSYDDGTLGATAHHQHVWDWHAANTTHDWAVVLEDDAVPVDGFRDQLDAALTVAPAPIVSLYLGTGYPRQLQPIIKRAITNADTDTHWLTADWLAHAVAVAVPANQLPMTLDPAKPTDEAITAWARRHRYQIAYTAPSIVNHADTTPVIHQRPDHSDRTQPRRAWQVGTRTQWTHRAATLC